jgi:hypothetical protein
VMDEHDTKAAASEAGLSQDDTEGQPEAMANHDEPKAATERHFNEQKTSDGLNTALLTFWLGCVVYSLWKEMKGERCKKAEEGRKA